MNLFGGVSEMEYATITKVELRPEGADEFEMTVKLLALLNLEYNIEDDYRIVLISDECKGRL